MSFIYSTIIYLVIVIPVHFLATAVHELGHYVVFRLFRITPMWMDIGSGEMLYKFRYCGTWFQIQPSPFSGGVVVAPGHIKRMGLWGVILMLAAGPLCELIFAFGLIVLANYLPAVAASPLLFLGYVVAIISLLQFWPRRKIVKVDGKSKETRSDGFQIINFWKRRAQFKIVNEDW